MFWPWDTEMLLERRIKTRRMLIHEDNTSEAHCIPNTMGTDQEQITIYHFRMGPNRWTNYMYSLYLPVSPLYLCRLGKETIEYVVQQSPRYSRAKPIE